MPPIVLFAIFAVYRAALLADFYTSEMCVDPLQWWMYTVLFLIVAPLITTIKTYWSFNTLNRTF